MLIAWASTFSVSIQRHGRNASQALRILRACGTLVVAWLTILQGCDRVCLQVVPGRGRCLALPGRLQNGCQRQLITLEAVGAIGMGTEVASGVRAESGTLQGFRIVLKDREEEP